MSITMKIHLILIFLLASITLYSQDKYQIVSNTSTVRIQIKDASHKLNSLQADFIQKKDLTFLNEVIQSEGKFIFQSPNSIRWEYTEPYQYLIIIDNNVIKIKNEQKESQFDMASNPIFKQINKLMLSTVKGDILLNKDFSSKVYENKTTYKIELLPQDKNMQEFISTIALILNKKDLTVISIKLTEPSEDYTLITFSNKILNEIIPKNSFLLH